ncbi:MAG: LLM class flavin-dependent oxidoreductase [Candidatus Methylomirabilia bacterium]
MEAAAISVGVQTWGTDLPALRRYWAEAESPGYQRLTYGDGLWAWTYDGWTMLGALALLTRGIRIGPAVTYCFDPFSRHPSWLAKAAAVDHLSNGRLDLRLGVGAEDPGAAAFWKSHGVSYPGAGDRVECLEEGIRIVAQLWEGGPVDFAGRFFTLKGARLSPRPLQTPRPPVWVAAMGRRALRVVALHADGWEASYLTPAAYADRARQLRSLLEQVLPALSRQTA